MQYEYWNDMLKRSGMAGHFVIALLGTQFQTVMNHKMDILVSWTSSNYHNASALHMDVSTLPPPLKVQKLQHQNQREARDNYGGRDSHGGQPMMATTCSHGGRGDKPVVTCHACGQVGHVSPECTDAAAKDAY